MARIERFEKDVFRIRLASLVTCLMLSEMAIPPTQQTFAGNAKPDPTALLRGVEESRGKCPSARLELSVVITFPTNPTETREKYKLVVAFDGINRRYDQFQTIVWAKPGNKPGVESDMDRMKRLGGNAEAFVRAGYGEFKDVHLRSSFDGLQFLQYAKEMGARIMDQAQGTPDFVFDPRILGISDEFGIQRTIANSLFFEKAKAITLVGREVIDGKTTWHVHVLDRNSNDNDFWIEDDDTFRVLKCSSKASYAEVENVSTYREGNEWPLPEKVINRKFDLKTGQVARQIEVIITKAEFGVKVDPKLWTLAGLGIPLGELVIDERHQKIAGHFDGEGLTKDYSAAVKKGREAEKHPLRWILVLTSLIAMAVLAAVVVKRRNWLREGRI